MAFALGMMPMGDCRGISDRGSFVAECFLYLTKGASDNYL